MKSNVCIVLPTYNEVGNIKKLIVEILSNCKKLKQVNLKILVVDDSSPDGTGEIVKKLSKKNKKIILLTGEKRGLGVAYLRGFNYAINTLKADILFQMDSDFSHDPKEIPIFLEKINESDVVVGSRYIKGGAIPDWPLYRKITSFIANLLAKTATGIPNVHDLTSGYRAIRSQQLNKINFKSLDLKGYAFIVELLYQLHLTGSKISEIPIVFNDRKYGRTKLGGVDILEFFFYTIKLPFRNILAK